MGDPDEGRDGRDLILSTSKQRDPPQDAAQQHSPSAHHQQEQKQPTALLRTIGRTGRTHSSAATPDFSAPLRIIGCPDGLTSLQPRRITTPLRTIGCPRRTRLQPRRTSLQLRTTSCPGRTHSPVVSPDQSAHLRRPTTQAPKRQ